MIHRRTVLRDDDIRFLLFKGTHGNDGLYKYANWQIQLADDSSNIEAYLVSIHEHMHSFLNDSTAYGTILHTYADLIRGGVGRLNQIFDDLEYRCVRVNEIFATFLSSLIVSMKDISPVVVSQEDLLVKYPKYLKYLRKGKELCRGFSGGYLWYHAVASSIRICMQSLALKKLSEIGLMKFKLSDLTQFDFPDTRFEIVRQLVNPNFWQEALNYVYEKNPGLPGWEVIFASEHDNSLYNKAFEAEFEVTSQAIMNGFYERLSTRLEDQNVYSLSFNGHQKYTRSMIEQSRILFESYGFKPTIVAFDGDVEFEEEQIIRSFAHEGYKITDKPIQATLSEIDLVPKEEWKHLVSGFGEDKHYFVTSRFSDRLKLQYDFLNSKNIVFPSSRVPVLCLRRHVLEGNYGKVELYLLDDPKQLRDLATLGFPIISNISLATRADDSFFSVWGHSLEQETEMTFLLDSNPFDFFIRCQKQKSFHILYNQIKLSFTETNRHVFVCQMQKMDLRYLVVAPCSLAVLDSLIYFISNLPNEGVFAEDKSFLLEPSVERLLNLTFGHLFYDEHYFDFSAN